MPTLEEMLQEKSQANPNMLRTNMEMMPLMGSLPLSDMFANLGTKLTGFVDRLTPDSAFGQDISGFTNFGFGDYQEGDLQNYIEKQGNRGLPGVGQMAADTVEFGAKAAPFSGLLKKGAGAAVSGSAAGASKLGQLSSSAGQKLLELVKSNPQLATILGVGAGGGALSSMFPDGEEAQAAQVPQMQAQEQPQIQQPSGPRQLSAADIDNVTALREFIKLRGDDTLGSDVGRTFSKEAPGTSARRMSNLGYSDAGNGNYIPKQALGAAMLQSKLKDMEARKPSVKDIRDLKKYRQGREDKYLENPKTMMEQRFSKIKGEYAQDTEMFAKLQGIKDALAVAGSPDEAMAILSEPGVKELLEMEQKLANMSAAEASAQKNEEDDGGWGTLLALLGGAGAVGAGAYALKKGKLPKGLLDKLPKRGVKGLPAVAPQFKMGASQASDKLDGRAIREAMRRANARKEPMLGLPAPGQTSDQQLKESLIQLVRGSNTKDAGGKNAFLAEQLKEQMGQFLSMGTRYK